MDTQNNEMRMLVVQRRLFSKVCALWSAGAGVDSGLWASAASVGCRVRIP